MYILKFDNKGSDEEQTVSGSLQETNITLVVSSLTPATKYNFTLITVLDGNNSTGFSFEAITGKWLFYYSEHTFGIKYFDFSSKMTMCF